MSKPKLVVLAFLHRQPMHGYQIGHAAEEFGLPVWASIKLPTVYKALQDLDAAKDIRGEQVSEGNTPPRTVYHLNPKGVKHLRQLVLQYLSSPKTSVNDWWLALSLAWKAITRQHLETATRSRLERLSANLEQEAGGHCQQILAAGELSPVHRFIWQLGTRHLQVEQAALKELLAELSSGRHDDYFLQNGE